MKRDMNLVREILLRLEPLPADGDNPVALTVGEPPLDIPGYTKEQITYHIRLMAQGDLITHGGLSGDGFTRISRFMGLRWRGHEFLDDVRDPKTWEDTNDKLKKIGGGSLEIAWELAKAYLRTHGLPL
jgi:hypothetical protein